ncbi:MAG: MATE family efflux transporter [Christensenellaceae bacterium]
MLFSRQSLKQLIIPLMIEQTLAFTVGLVDTFMVATIGEQAVSGVALVDTINVLLINLLAAMAGGGAIVMGQYLGIKEYGNAQHAAKQLVMAMGMFSIAIMAVCLLMNAQILSLVFGRVEAAVMGNAQTYFYITAASYPFIALFNACAALFRGMGDSKTAMLNALIMNIANIAGNAILIYGFNMGVLGAAVSTLVARIITAATMLHMLRNKKRVVCVRSYRLRDIDFRMIGRILRIGIPNGLESSMFQIGKVIVTSLVAMQSTAAIAAHAVSNSLALFEIIPGQAMGLAILAVVAQCVGAGEYGQAEYYTKKMMKQAYLYMIILNMGMFALMRPILGLYNLSDGAVALAMQIMTLHSFSAAAIWPISFTLPNALRAAGDVKYTMVISGVSMWVFRIVLSYLFVYSLGWGVMSVWVAMIIDWGVRSVFFVTRWRSGKWKKFNVLR